LDERIFPDIDRIHDVIYDEMQSLYVCMEALVSENRDSMQLAKLRLQSQDLFNTHPAFVRTRSIKGIEGKIQENTTFT
jgi:hypothetical protein